LASWELQCADPPGTLRSWQPGERLGPAIHDIWARRNADDSWRFQLMLDESAGDEWVCRRDPRIRRPVATLTFEIDGVRYLAPEVQLFYKARGLRPKDGLDFEAALPRLSESQSRWLRESLQLVHPEHPWLEQL
ncbi:MAG: nucleotidyltransferase domain-containing protein, partial [Tepidiformaceae bacterium]